MIALRLLFGSISLWNMIIFTVNVNNIANGVWKYVTAISRIRFPKKCSSPLIEPVTESLVEVKL